MRTPAYPWGILFLASALGLFFTQPLAAHDEPAAQAVATPSEEATSPPLPSGTTSPAVDTYSRGRVLEILEGGTTDVSGRPLPFQIVKVRLETGAQAGNDIVIAHGRDYTVQQGQMVRPGTRVVVLATPQPDGTQRYAITDTYRLPALWWLLVGFLATAFLVGQKKGLWPLVGLIASVIVLVKAIVPLLVAGWPPVWVGLGGGAAIITLSLLLGHGRDRRTKIALVSTLLSVLAAAAIAQLMVSVAHLAGLGSEEVSLFQFGRLADIDVRGLLLAAIMIGTIGVLDDVTTAQTAAVDEIHQANPSLTVAELYRRGLSVGREHIAALVNTLVLAYAGASLPLLLILMDSPNQPFWVTINSEFIAEEIVRTLAGGLTLIVAVPLATWIAAWQFAKQPN